MHRGLFITFEGGEGTGKSTQILKLGAKLREQGIDVLVTREPGGSAPAEEIRKEIVSGDVGRWSPLAETLLVNAARDSHLRETIRPALRQGKVVLCDRFMDSTRAYQGVAGGVEESLVDALEKLVVGETRPDLTLILDLDPDLGLARAKATENRFELKDREFHSRLRSAYLGIARSEPHRCKIIDASASSEQVFSAIWQLARPLLSRIQ
ncbi:MAG TPA: dTMP kinase [Aestuariivirgaceae bacterium]|jgi:dTMP kinase